MRSAPASRKCATKRTISTRFSERTFSPANTSRPSRYAVRFSPTHTHMHTHAQAHTHVHTRARTHTHTTHIAYSCTHIHMHTHTHAHTRTHTHTQEISTFEDLVDEIYNKVSYATPFIPNTRSPSSCFCLLYRCFQMRLTYKQVRGCGRMVGWVLSLCVCVRACVRAGGRACVSVSLFAFVPCPCLLCGFVAPLFAPVALATCVTGPEFRAKDWGRASRVSAPAALAPQVGPTFPRARAHTHTQTCTHAHLLMSARRRCWCRRVLRMRACVSACMNVCECVRVSTCS